MRKARYTSEEIIRKLREADVLIGQGKTIAEACKALGVTNKTYFRRRNMVGTGTDGSRDCYGRWAGMCAAPGSSGSGRSRGSRCCTSSPSVRGCGWWMVRASGCDRCGVTTCGAGTL